MPGHAGGGHVSGGGFHGGTSFHGGSFSSGRPGVTPAVRLRSTGGQNGSGDGKKSFSPAREFDTCKTEKVRKALIWLIFFVKFQK